MPLQLAVPLEQEFTLEKSDKQYGTNGSPTRILIRQATQGQHERRANLFANIIREFADEESDVVRMIQRFSFEELKRIEVFLTLHACNITGIDGEPLFDFDSKGNISESNFNKAWSQLPPMICNEMHDCVLEVNIDWKPQGEVKSRGN